MLFRPKMIIAGASAYPRECALLTLALTLTLTLALALTLTLTLTLNLTLTGTGSCGPRRGRSPSARDLREYLRFVPYSRGAAGGVGRRRSRGPVIVDLCARTGGLVPLLGCPAPLFRSAHVILTRVLPYAQVEGLQ